MPAAERIELIGEAHEELAACYATSDYAETRATPWRQHGTCPSRPWRGESHEPLDITTL